MAINSVLSGLLGLLRFCQRVRLASEPVCGDTVHGEHNIPGAPLNFKHIQSSRVELPPKCAA